MLQKESYINILDNSGGRKGYCIHIYKGYKCRYANIGDVICVAIRKLRKQHKRSRMPSKIKMNIKKGDTCKALILETKKGIKKIGEEFVKFKRNNVILLTEKKKYAGTRIFLPVLESFRFTRYSRLAFIGAGLIR